MPAREPVSNGSSEGSPKRKVDEIVTTDARGAVVTAVKVALETAIAPSATTALSPDHAPVSPNADAVSWIQAAFTSTLIVPCASVTPFV